MESEDPLISLNGSPFAVEPAYEHCSGTFDGPHDTAITARNRLALLNGESAGVEGVGIEKQRTRVGIRDQLDP
jgi:hypothetical protein